MAEEKIYRLLYRSKSAIPSDGASSEVAMILSAARRNNAERDITGALVLYEDTFAQILEGEETTVMSLFSAIESDERHSDVEQLAADHVSRRAFSKWRMALVGRDGEADLPLFDVGGALAPVIDDGSDDGDVAECKVALAALRHAVRK